MVTLYAEDVSKLIATDVWIWNFLLKEMARTHFFVQALRTLQALFFACMLYRKHIGGHTVDEKAFKKLYTGAEISIFMCWSFVSVLGGEPGAHFSRKLQQGCLLRLALTRGNGGWRSRKRSRLSIYRVPTVRFFLFYDVPGRLGSGPFSRCTHFNCHFGLILYGGIQHA